jgi:hypothetical protein
LNIDRRFIGTFCLIIALMMEAARASETSVDIQLRTWQYIPEDSELRLVYLLVICITTFNGQTQAANLYLCVVQEGEQWDHLPHLPYHLLLYSALDHTSDLCSYAG